MNYTTLQIKKQQESTTITLNRPDVHNAMNEDLMKELTHCFKTLSSDEKTRIIILTGNGKSFSAGADLNWMKSMVNYTQEENIQDSNLLLDLYESIYMSPKPVIGKINGHGFGGGIGLIAVCDITIGIPNCKFAFSEVNLGIIPSVISSYVALRLNAATMRRLFITGERFDSAYAHTIGLLDYVVEPDVIDTTVQEYVAQLKTSGPQAIHEIKKLLQKIRELNLQEYKKYTVETIARLRVSEEGQEGINAFLEKRKNTWSR